MIERKLIKETVKKYIKHRNMNQVLDGMCNDLLNYCKDSINGYFSKEFFDFYNNDKSNHPKSEDRLTEDQNDVNFSVWELESCGRSTRDVSRVKLQYGYDTLSYFPQIFVIKLKSLSLPRFFGGDLDDYLPEDFKNGYVDRITEIVKITNSYMKEIKALEDTLKQGNMTITSVKEYYPELYALIKN